MVQLEVERRRMATGIVEELVMVVVILYSVLRTWFALLRGKSLDTPQVHHPPAVELTSTQVTYGYCL